jgi:hypothetical protein
VYESGKFQASVCSGTENLDRNRIFWREFQAKLLARIERRLTRERRFSISHFSFLIFDLDAD